MAVAVCGELSPLKFRELFDREEVVSIKTRQRFIPPSPPVSYTRVVWNVAGLAFESLLMYDAGRECWRDVSEHAEAGEIAALFV